MAFMACMERHKCDVGQLNHADEHCMASVMLGARAEINPGPQPVPDLTRDNPKTGLTQDIPPVGSVRGSLARLLCVPYLRVRHEILKISIVLSTVCRTSIDTLTFADTYTDRHNTHNFEQ